MEVVAMKAWITVCKLFLGLLICGGSAAYAEVTLTDNGTTVTLANGIVTATIGKNNGQITSMKLGTLETVSGNVYYSMDGGSSYQQPGPCVYSMTTLTADMADLSFFQVYTNQSHAFDIDIHYVMRSADSGVYSYAVLSHPASYPATSVGEWRTVWKHPRDGDNFRFENIYVDDLRHWQGPSAFDMANASTTPIAEVAYLNTGVRANTYFGKYDYSAEYNKIGTWGHASSVNQAGVWVVLGSFEFLNDGPTKQDLTLSEAYTLLHYGRNHYGGSGTSVAAGESWSKIYGPWLLYMNSCPASADDCWTDAKARVQTEQAAWPYPWLTTNGNYPQDSGRGTVSGALSVSDPLKPSLGGANAWVGLAQPNPGGNWQNESKRYQYWVQADSAGSFSIPHVRPGTYTLYAFVTGAVGEYSRADVTVSAGATTSLGTVSWNVLHPGNSIAWEIGVPDRSAAEFWHGSDYFQAFLYNNFANEFPNPLNYTVGTSNWATDWNYVHSAYIVDGVNNQWPWTITFNLASVPASGNATLTLAWASTNSAAEQVFVNDPDMVNRPLADFYPSVGGGNALIREGIHAKYGVDYVSIPVSLLRQGANTITLLQRRGISGTANHVMYDYINLELP
jgi:rhamnogalacturonan endolyase